MKKNDSERIGEQVRLYRRGSTYCANLQYRGRQFRKSLKTNNVKTARRVALAWEQEVLSVEVSVSGSASPPTLQQVTEMLLTSCESEERAPRTISRYRSVFQTFSVFAEKSNVRDILDLDLAFVDSYRLWRKLQGRSPKTIYNEVTLLRQLLKFARRRKLIRVDPLEGLRNPEPRGRQQPYWTHEQIQCVLSATPERQRLIFTFLAETGVRIGEAKWLTWNDIDLERGVVHIRSKDGWRTKTGNIRSIPMSPLCRAIIQETSRRGRWVFTAPPSKKYPKGDHQISERRLLQALKRILKKLGLSGHLHTFRHSFISRAIFNGTPEAVVRLWAGHVDDATLKLYTHLASAQSHDAMIRLHQQLEQKKTEPG
ncbi:MAG TPA: site-specific integrase [Planctomicrobium sp.]|nr:site-specific integrase [Planctomicrobium sp.]